jgi:hypothetical protein
MKHNMHDKNLPYRYVVRVFKLGITRAVYVQWHGFLTTIKKLQVL